MSNFNRGAEFHRQLLALSGSGFDTEEDLVSAVTSVLSNTFPTFKEYQEKLRDLKSGEPNGAMRCAAMGEFHVSVKHSCTACDYHGADDECEVCGGEIDYYQNRSIDWSTCKDIYECMHDAKVKSLGFGGEDGE